MTLIRTADIPDAVTSFVRDTLVPGDVRRDMIEQVLNQLPIEQSVEPTGRVSLLDPRSHYMVNLEAEATIKIRAMDQAPESTDEGVAFDPLYHVCWVLKARCELVLGAIPAAEASAFETEPVQALYPESQRDFGLIRNLYDEIERAMKSVPPDGTQRFEMKSMRVMLWAARAGGAMGNRRCV